MSSASSDCDSVLFLFDKAFGVAFGVAFDVAFAFGVAFAFTFAFGVTVEGCEDCTVNAYEDSIVDAYEDYGSSCERYKGVGVTTPTSEEGILI